MKINCPECKRRVRIRRNNRFNTCKCGYQFPYRTSFSNIKEKYLLDANVFIYAINNDQYRGKHCHEVLTGAHPVATTGQVMDEVKQYHNYSVKVYNVKKISPEVDALRYNSVKELSLADKSLIQCAIDHPEVVGIITNDKDIISVVPNHLIKSEKTFFIGRANEFLKKGF